MSYETMRAIGRSGVILYNVSEFSKLLVSLIQLYNTICLQHIHITFYLKKVLPTNSLTQNVVFFLFFFNSLFSFPILM
jgi:hypothetical protein